MSEVANALVLRLHDALHVPTDQAPGAHDLLVELCHALGIDRPRLFVIAAEQPNGFALAGRPTPTIVITDGAFDRLSRDELRGLLALLTARLADPRSASDAVIASLAHICCPFRPARGGVITWALTAPARALIRTGLPGERWFDVDRSAAAIVGSDLVVRTLKALDGAPDTSSAAPVAATASIFCQRPVAANDLLHEAFVTQPSSADRIARLEAAVGA